MASPVPAKVQPLHNFSLPHLKWKNHRSGRSRLAGEASSSSPPHRSPSPEKPRQSSPQYVFRRPSPLHRQSPMCESESDADPNHVDRRTISESSTKSVAKRSSQISIRLRKNGNNVKQNDAVVEQNHSSAPGGDAVPAAAEDESLPKSWNLRPRRPPVNHKQSPGGLTGLQENKASNQTIINKQLSELNCNNSSDLRNLKKQKFSIALSRNEIEEDVFFLTGSKPSRRPKKRSRTIQKQLDTLFPGMWLDSITADSYKVSEAPP